MLRNRPFPLVPFGISALLVCGGAVALIARVPAQTAPPVKPAAAAPAAELATRIVTRAAAQTDKGPFGESHAFLTGESRSLKDLLVAEVVLEPGKEIHPPHVHADEEFLYVTKGEGTWHLEGKDVAAHEGDTLYVEPWKLHGITNTGKEKLTFFVVKWNGRQLPVPEKPAAK